MGNLVEMGESSERDSLVQVVVGLAEEVVAWTKPGDQPRFFRERAIGGQHANRDGDPIAIVGEARIVALAAGVLTGPELLGATPGLKVPRQGLVQPAGIALAHVDSHGSAVVLDLAEDVDAGLAV